MENKVCTNSNRKNEIMNKIVVSKLLSLIHMLLVLLYLYSYVLLPYKKKN